MSSRTDKTQCKRPGTKRRQWRLFPALVVAIAMLAASCGDSDDDSSSETVTQPAPTEAPAPEPEPAPADEPEAAPTVAPEPEPTPAELFEIRIAIGPEIQDMDPQRSNAVWNSVLLWGNVTEALVTTDDEGAVIPELAESYELMDDGLTWRFNLRDGITFHNGEAFNADAVKFSLDRIAGEEFGSLIIGFFKDYASTEIVDDLTVDVVTSKPSPDFLVALTSAAILPPVFTASDPNAQNDNPTGTGPFTFTSKSAEQMVMTKNADYWGGPPSGPETVTGLVRPEVSSRVAGLSAGNEFEVALDIPAELISEVPAVTYNAPSGTMMLWMNGFNGITQDPLVREAIVLAVDQEGIRTAFIGEENSVSGQCQFGVPGSAGYNPDLPEQPYDPDRARELLEQAGAIGATLKFAVPTARYAAGEEIAEVVIGQLEAVGFKVEYILSPYQTWLGSLFEPRETRAELFYTRAGGVTPSVTNAWNLFVIKDGRIEMIGYDNYPGLDQTVLDALGEIDPVARTALFAEATQGVCDTNGFVFLYKEKGIVGHLDTVVIPERADSRVYWTMVELTG
ncbi:MAG: ABC transporter substrate-binding protein [Actinomycetota bacterium]|nr:ABC transporter substrate-binding protein [Actinomycetota bacterium]